MPCGLPVVLMTPIACTSCRIISLEWSWQLFHVIHWSHVAVAGSGLSLCHTPLDRHIVLVNFNQLTMNFCCRLIPCIQKLNYCLDLMLRTPFFCWVAMFKWQQSPHLCCRMMIFNTGLPTENNHWLCNKPDQSKTSCNNIIALLTYFCTAFHIMLLRIQSLITTGNLMPFVHCWSSLLTVLLLANVLVAEMPAQPFFTLLTRKHRTVKKGVKGLCAKKKISKGLYGPHLIIKQKLHDQPTFSRALFVSLSSHLFRTMVSYGNLYKIASSSHG